jgi:hypothetical protein
MSFKIDATDFNNSVTRVNIDKKEADYCPICNKHVAPINLGSFLCGIGASSPYLQTIYRCPSARCGMIFFALYRGVPQGGRGMMRDYWYFYERVEPGYPLNPDIPPNVAKLSSNFKEIYSQAHFAEAYGLNEICGVGYRKALEFLVKDFLITKAEEYGTNKEAIIKSFLSTCINNYIKDPMTKSVAERATWLGNDETHYYRRWENKDISDLKTLLRLTINAIENQLLAESYENEMKK